VHGHRDARYKWQGVAAERIRYEFFGPADELLAPDAVELAA
jgi:hypothetical protein